MGKNCDIIGLGYCGMDYLCKVPEIPFDDKIQMEEHLIQGGGPCATAIFTAARLGCRTTFIGTVGSDEAGKEIMEELQTEGVDTSQMIVRSSAKSAVSYCWAESGTGHRSIVWTKGNAEPLTIAEVDIEFLKSAKLLHLDGHQMEAAFFAAETVRKNGKKVFLDAGSLYPGMTELLPLCDVVVASEKFANQLTGSGDINNALKAIYSYGVEWCAVTMGSRGALGYDGENFINQDAFEVDVIDTTGAGDVYHGAFAYRYISGGTWAECMEFAAVAAALKCQKLGGRTGIPTLSKIENWLKG